MPPFFNKYISALLHNPNILTLGGICIEVIQKENDATAVSSIILIIWSKLLSKIEPKAGKLTKAV